MKSAGSLPEQRLVIEPSVLLALKNYVVISTLSSVFRYPNETLSLVFDILHEILYVIVDKLREVWPFSKCLYDFNKNVQLRFGCFFRQAKAARLLKILT